MQNLILLKSDAKDLIEPTTNCFTALKTWFISTNINWIEIILTGTFTLLGALGGASIAGFYTIRTMKKQLKYDKTNKDLDLLDSQLKINQRFSTLLNGDIESLNSLFSITNMDKDTEGYYEIVIITLKNTIHNLEETYQSLSELNIDNVPYEEYSYYIETLDDNKEIQKLCTIQITNFKNINENIKEGLTKNPFTLDFIKDSSEESLITKKDLMTGRHELINQKQGELVKRNEDLKSELKKLA